MTIKQELAQAEERLKHGKGLVKTQQGLTDYGQDFFGKPTFLTVSGQLNAEIYATALSDVYTFGRSCIRCVTPRPPPSHPSPPLSPSSSHLTNMARFHALELLPSGKCGVQPSLLSEYKTTRHIPELVCYWSGWT